jgi:hypothetical protein
VGDLLEEGRDGINRQPKRHVSAIPSTLNQ